ncbi:hypothetical protein PIB30_039879 [Stylosanthes scabra]|uniref:Uncharacterized protein n=1 Tax=Stylosanthes scabra TaxID=79078 RepID=A0ABU6WFS2_9FABA|nr:hypothetical protein [Stylosanthes scabra]
MVLKTAPAGSTAGLRTDNLHGLVQHKKPEMTKPLKNHPHSLISLKSQTPASTSPFSNPSNQSSTSLQFDVVEFNANATQPPIHHSRLGLPSPPTRYSLSSLSSSVACWPSAFLVLITEQSHQALIAVPRWWSSYALSPPLPVALPLFA